MFDNEQIPDNDGGEWIVFRTVYDPIEATMIKDLLSSAGISAVVRSSKVSPYPVNIGKMGEVRILIRSADLEDAERLLA